MLGPCYYTKLATVASLMSGPSNLPCSLQRQSAGVVFAFWWTNNCNALQDCSSMLLGSGGQTSYSGGISNWNVDARPLWLHAVKLRVKPCSPACCICAWYLNSLQCACMCAGTFHPLPTEPLEMPPLNLSGRLPERRDAVLNLETTGMQAPPGGGAASEFSAWPEFHNGVAAGESSHS